MHTVERNLLCAYPQLFDTVCFGHTAAPRGQRVTEANTPQLWTLKRPWEWVLAIPGRKLNPFFALAEVVWMWTGKGGAEFITYYNKSIGQFLDEGIPYFHGAYGKRVRHYGYSERPFRELPHPLTTGQAGPENVEVDQLTHVIAKLQQDPETRQAAVTLWDPIKDNFVRSKDHPCNNMLYFSQRRGKLNFSVVMRSNDLIWGTPYNMIQFAHLQALIAGSLDLQVGEYTVMANNLHFYHDLYPDTLSVVKGWSEQVANHGVSLSQVSDSVYHQRWDMRWTVDALDCFMRNVWEPCEDGMRKFQQDLPYRREQAPDEDVYLSQVEAYFNTKWMDLKDTMDRQGVPEYWTYVFAVLFMYHCRKAKAVTMYNSLFVDLPKPLKWAIQDFTSKGV